MMTEGEKMVWAATYSRRYSEIYLNKDPLPGSPKVREQLKLMVIRAAIEDAYCAVMYLREAEKSIIDGWGDNSKCYELYKAMIDKG